MNIKAKVVNIFPLQASFSYSITFDTMSLFGTSSDNEDTPTFSGMQTSPYMGINPNYLDTMDQYILPEDAGPVRSRAQMMFSTIGSATVVGAGFGGLQTFRYSGLGWLRVSWTQCLTMYFQCSVKLNRICLESTAAIPCF